MPLFKVGEHVQIAASRFIPPFMRHGTVVRVIRNAQGIDWFTQYVVSLEGGRTATFYQTQLRTFSQNDPSSSSSQRSPTA